MMKLQKLLAISKENYFTALQRKFPNDSWKFLVGDSAAVNAVTKVSGILL